MKMSPLVIGTVFLATSVSVMASDVAPSAAAAQAINQLGQGMRKKLSESILKNGPAGAIDVCAKEAPTISSRIEKELGVTIKRTSLNVRNIQNAPDPAEKEVLETLAASYKAGRALPAGVTPFPHDPGRFYKAVTVEKTCLTCHGDANTMSDQVRKEIAAMYPEDRAINYKEGDFRGIISVSVK